MEQIYNKIIKFDQIISEHYLESVDRLKQLLENNGNVQIKYNKLLDDHEQKYSWILLVSIVSITHHMGIAFILKVEQVSPL